ncbi:SAM-dependent MidA family methyltransferase [Natronocella acetinitrilica]|uniref:SAM-dependent MidA family methyltransferase n=1 Tax=Natronocella acetinitrilica TaxID=414046 RepID=A0AAE3KEK8_9GAMM|nr:SAM-dependent methyltransferase [Natronocella acetinitrilica]MCP1673192.1 SAM-dependent MidA family methyltransferase [Natronocella acetinitrilica]
MTDPFSLPEGFPAPDPDALAISRDLVAHQQQQIDAGGGWLAFDAWMETALYTPGLGYYAAGATKFGAAGDFITSPMVSPLFAWTLAAEARRLLRQGGDTILEFGPGDGLLARDLLQELHRLDALPARYLLLERSADLRDRQAATLATLPLEVRRRVSWLDRLPDEPIRGLVLANEVADALPVKRFRRETDGVVELGVVRDGDGFQWQGRATPAANTVVDTLEREAGDRFPAGYESEWCPQLPPWVASIAEVLDFGAALLVDYGYPRGEYYLAERRRGTLRCHYRHRAHDDPFMLPGLQDITAHVDFTAAAEAAVSAGAELLGFATQAHYLMGAGVTDILQARMAQEPARQLELAQQAKTLLLPGEMGERFRVLGFAKGGDPGLTGFSTYNHVNRL